MKTVKGFILGLIIGAILMFVFSFYVYSKKELKTYEYVKLKEDFKIDNEGILKKGTILRIDEPMPEGFTRYIMYLNLKGDGTEIYKTDKNKDFLIIPYWLLPSDTLK